MTEQCLFLGGLFWTAFESLGSFSLVIVFVPKKEFFLKSEINSNRQAPALIGRRIEGSK